MKDDRLYLEHILEAVQRIRDYTIEGKEQFLVDVRTQNAVVGNLQVLGEAAKKVSAATVAAYPDVPWRQMAGLRDRVVHDDFGVSLENVWDVVENHLDKVV